MDSESGDAQTLVFSSSTYNCYKLTAERVCQQLGFIEVFAVIGLPPEYTDILLRSVQVCDVPHTWRIRPVKKVAEVDCATLAAARVVLQQDIDQLNSQVITYFGVRKNGSRIFLGAGALRDKLNVSYLNQQFPVVSRAVVNPEYRNYGVGSLIIRHRFALAWDFYGQPAKAIHFATEDPKILKVARDYCTQQNLGLLLLGKEFYETKTGRHAVDDFLVLPADYLLALRDATLQLDGIKKTANTLGADLRQYFKTGNLALSGDRLFERLESLQNLANPLNTQTKAALNLMLEFFRVRSNIGARD